MLLGGLWHGASWTFVVWGALHGIYLCVERLFRNRKAGIEIKHDEALVLEAERPYKVERASVIPVSGSINKFLLALITFFFINLAWVFFRASDFTSAWRLLSSMFGLTEGIAVMPTIDMIKVTVITILMFMSHWFMKNTSVWQVAQKTKWYIIAIAWSLMLILIILSQKSSDSFIYFQF